LPQDGCEDGLSLIDDFQACFYRAEALLSSIVLDILKTAAQLVGFLPYNLEQGSGDKLRDDLFFLCRDRPKVSDYPMVSTMGKLMEKDSLVLGGETNLLLVR